MTRGVELRDLETFVVVAEELHFANAAQRLHVVPAAVTQRIQALEGEFGVDLFRRTSRRVELTVTGLRLVEEARAALRTIDELRDLARVLSDEASTRISIAVGPNLGGLLGPLLARLSETLPKLRPTGVSLWSAEAATAVQTGEADAAILRGPVLRSGLEGIRIGTTVDRFVALPRNGPLAAADRPLTRRDFHGRPVLIPDRSVAAGMHDSTAAYFEVAGAQPEWRPHRLQGFELLLPFVAVSGAAALVPELDARTAPSGVVLRPLAESGPEVPVLLVVRRGDTSETTRALRAIASFVGAPLRHGPGQDSGVVNRA